MMTKTEVLHRILDQSNLLLSALDAEDLDIVDSVLEERELWIRRYESADEPPESERGVLAALQRDYRELHEESIARLELLRELLAEAQNRNRSARSEADKTKKIHDRYANQLEYSGMNLDFKK